MPNIFDMLEADHREVLAVLEQISGDTAGRLDEPARRLLLDRLIVAESRHEAAEELAFWPTVRRRLGDGGALADQGRRQEGDAKYVLDALRYEQEGISRAEHLEAAAQLIRAHIAFEEEQVWPPLRRALGMIGARTLAMKYRAALMAAPTRPHPHGPEGALGLATLGVAAALGDKMRDKLSGRARRLDFPIQPPGGTASGDRIDAIEFLTSEHQRVESLLGRVETVLAAGDEPGDDLVGELVRDLSVHDAIEREHLYPVVRQRLERGNEAYQASLEEHGDIAAVLAEIDRRPEHDQLRRDDLGRLARLVRTHVAEEEGAVFAALRAHLSAQELAELGRDLSVARAKAPTHPHPHVAGSGIGTRVSRLLAAPLDKTRDAISGRT